ncbi:MAG: ABC transporter ATP-binding protein [Clostridia bacterium]|nr:ABC transporter ATP-binding protein [Clostridia bacterium]
MFSLDKVCFAYEGHIALRYITLDVARGETVVLQGPNGCGKSTLLKLLNGLVYAEEGTYKFDGDVIDAKSMKNNVFSKQFHQRVGFIFQNSDVQLFCSNVEEEISFGPRQMGLSEEEVKQRTDDVIALLDIEHLRERAPYHLSGGEKRKVAIACILSMNPEALVLDEPLAGLDRKTQEWLVGFLLELKKAGKSLIISTHNDELAHTLADRLVVIGEDHSVESVTEN